MAQHPGFEKFEAWALWEYRLANGSPVGAIGGGGETMLHKLSRDGELMPGCTAPGFDDFDCFEARFSESVARLAVFNRRGADVLRCEHGVIRPNGIDHRDTRQTRARAMGVASLRTYERILKSARDWVIDDVGS